MDTQFDVAIIGSGPAGIFAARELETHSEGSIVIIDQYTYPSGGLLNDGKLNFNINIGIEFDQLGENLQVIESLMQKVKEVFTSFPQSKMVTDFRDKAFLNTFVESCHNHDVEVILAEQWHYGTDNSKKVVKGLRSGLKRTSFMLGQRVDHIEAQRDGFVLHCVEGKSTTSVSSRILLIAPGRAGSMWLRNTAADMGIEHHFGPIDIGIRVELSKDILEPVTRYIYDPKLRFITSRHGDRVRTFCTNPGGRVRSEKYDNFYLVNGDSLNRRKTSNTNFALLNTLELTEPLSDTTLFGTKLAEQFNLLGGGHPTMQRVGDFREGRRSRHETFFSSSLHYSRCSPSYNATPGDLAMGFPGRIIDNLWETMKTLDKIIPGILHPSTILYSPEIKFFDNRYPTRRYLETGVDRCFLAGDGAGKSRGIVGAAISGIIAARGIIKKYI